LQKIEIYRMIEKKINLKGRSVYVTGGAGLIGSFLVEDLVNLGAKVCVLDDFSKGSIGNLKTVKDLIEIREVDLERSKVTEEAFVGADIVFHLASRAYGIGYGNGRHLEVLNHNERITTNVVDTLSKIKPDHVLMTSSSCIYDDSGPETIKEQPIFEKEPEMANWGYGWAKRFLEQKSLILSKEAGIPVTIVRPFNIYGERYEWVGEFSQAIPMLVKRVMDGENPVVIWGSGRQKRNYMHALDCAKIMRQLVEVGYSGPAVNIGLEDTTSIFDLVTLICGVGNKSPNLIADTSKPEGRFCKSASSELLRSIIGDIPISIDLESGMKRMIEWYKNSFGAN